MRVGAPVLFLRTVPGLVSILLLYTDEGVVSPHCHVFFFPKVRALIRKYIQI